METLLDEILEIGISYESAKTTGSPITINLREEKEKKILKWLINERGVRDSTSLTNYIFFRRHPERHGKDIQKSEPNYDNLAKEWRRIREVLVNITLIAPRIPNFNSSTQAFPTTIPDYGPNF